MAKVKNNNGSGSTGMRRRTGVIIALAFSCLGGLGAAAALSRPSYSVAQVLWGLRHQQAAWLGHTIRVRGVLYLCPPTSDCGLPGSLDDERAATQHLFLDALGGELPALGVVRRIPLLNALLPPYPPQAWGRRGTYTVTIDREPAPVCAFKRTNLPYCVVLSGTLGW